MAGDDGAGDGASDREQLPPQDTVGSAALLAAGVIAAKRRGDHDGAKALLAAFPDPAAQSIGFYVIGDLAVVLLAQATGQTVEACTRRLSLAVAHGLPA